MTKAVLRAFGFMRGVVLIQTEGADVHAVHNVVGRMDFTGPLPQLVPPNQIVGRFVFTGGYEEYGRELLPVYDLVEIQQSNRP